MISTHVALSIEETRREAQTAIMSSISCNDRFRGRLVFTGPGEEMDLSVNHARA